MENYLAVFSFYFQLLNILLAIYLLKKMYYFKQVIYDKKSKLKNISIVLVGVIILFIFAELLNLLGFIGPILFSLIQSLFTLSLLLLLIKNYTQVYENIRISEHFVKKKFKQLKDVE